jgi:hypothetical protein
MSLDDADQPFLAAGPLVPSGCLASLTGRAGHESMTRADPRRRAAAVRFEGRALPAAVRVFTRVCRRDAEGRRWVPPGGRSGL